MSPKTRPFLRFSVRTMALWILTGLIVTCGEVSNGAAQAPALLEFKQTFHVGGLNDNGLLVGTPNLFGVTAPPGIWNSKTGDYQELGVLPGSVGSFATGINNTGQVSGITSLPAARAGFTITRATLWSGSSPSDLGAVNAAEGEGLSAARAINNSGLVVGSW